MQFNVTTLSQSGQPGRFLGSLGGDLQLDELGDGGWEDAAYEEQDSKHPLRPLWNLPALTSISHAAYRC